MRALLARPARHQGVRQVAGEERGRAAGAGLHPEEAGGDASRQGEEKGEPGGRGYRGLNQSRPTDPGSDYLALMRTRDTHTHTHNPAARTNKGIKSGDLCERRRRRRRGEKNQIA